MSLDRYRPFVPDWPRFLEAAGRPEPTVVRVHTGRVSPNSLAERLRSVGYRLSPLEGMPAFFRVDGGPRPVSFTLEHWLGLLYVQQASTGVAAPALDPRPGEHVLDLCAAPGGKTTHVADLMGDRGSIVAVDVSEGRIRGLLGNVYRLGHPSVMVVVGDGRELPEEAHFDRVLVDAPCSGEGTLRRRGGRPPKQSRSFMGYVTRAQEDLLRKAIRLTRPGGTVLYVTCTFAPEENEAVVSRVLADAPVDVEPLALPVPHAPGLTAFEGKAFDPRLEGAARIYPHHFDSGGLFLARLRKLEGDESGAAPAPWSPVPLVFPDDGMPEEEAGRLVASGMEAVEHFGVGAAKLEGRSWMVRGGRLWLHTLPAWPVPAWSAGKWRTISVGFRAVEFDTRGRPRPTNDFLQWLGPAITRNTVDLDDAEVLGACHGRPVPRDETLHGLQALRYREAVIGRGAATPKGVRNEIPKARRRDLEAIVTGAPPVDDD